MYKNILAIIDLDIIVVIALFVILFFYKKRFNMKDSINRIYSNIIMVTIFIIILEIADKFILLSNSNYLIPITKIINVSGFAMVPIVPYLWGKYLFENFSIKINSRFTDILIIINLIISIMSYNYGYIFSVQKDNIYQRGALFFLPITITYIFFIIILVNVYKNKDKVDKKQFNILMLFGIIPIIAAVIQISFNNILLIWGSVGVAIIMHFIYLQENMLKYDNLTGVWNRMTFESYFYNNFVNKNNTFSLIYIDVNDFKSINDNYGHNEGDLALINIAKVLKKCFIKNGKVGRIGGDEFIIVTDMASELELKNKICSIDLELQNLNRRVNRGYDLEISVGYKKFNNDYFTLSDYIKEIDELMYLDKKRKKHKVRSLN